MHLILLAALCAAPKIDLVPPDRVHPHSEVLATVRGPERYQAILWTVKRPDGSIQSRVPHPWAWIQVERTGLWSVTMSGTTSAGQTEETTASFQVVPRQ